MDHLMRALVIAVATLALRAVPPVSAQSAGGQARGAPTPARALLSVAEMRSITGRNDYPDLVDGDPDGEGAGGGSSCQYGGAAMMPGPNPPLLSVVLIPAECRSHQGKGLDRSESQLRASLGLFQGVGGGSRRRCVLRVLPGLETEALFTAVRQGRVG